MKHGNPFYPIANKKDRMQRPYAVTDEIITYLTSWEHE
jgi:hypothetical protein